MFGPIALVIGFIAVVFVVTWRIARHYDVKQWNNGYCMFSGEKWQCFDVASDGSRGYTDNLGHYTWISHNVDTPIDPNRMKVIKRIKYVYEYKTKDK